MRSAAFVTISIPSGSACSSRPFCFDAHEVGSLCNHLHTIWLSLLLTALLLPLLVSDEGNCDGALVEAVLLWLLKAKNVKGFISCSHLSSIIHTGDGQNTLRDEEVVPGEWLVTELTHCPIFGVGIGHDLVEDVVVPLDLQLEGDPGLLEQVCLNIGGGDFGGGAKVDTDELTESDELLF